MPNMLVDAPYHPTTAAPASAESITISIKGCEATTSEKVASGAPCRTSSRRSFIAGALTLISSRVAAIAPANRDRSATDGLHQDYFCQPAA